MRSLVITAAIIAGTYEARAAPSWPAMQTGSCDGLVYHQVVGSRSNVVTTYYDAALQPTTRPVGRSLERDAIGFVSTNGWHTRATANLAGSTIELATEVHRCEDLGSGCSPGRPATWGGDVFETIKVPKDTCIEYLSQLPGGLVLGTSRGTWAIPEGGHAKKLSAPRLRKVKALETVVFAQEGTTLHAIRWAAGAKAPTFDPLPVARSRTIAIHHRDTTLYMFTEQAVIALDVATLAEQWQLPGRHHALLMPEGAKEWAFVRIEKDQVILDVRRVANDEPQEVVRSRVVHEGPAIDADVTLLGDVYELQVAQQP